MIGVLWSPIAALICGGIARARGLSVSRYAAAGAVYSALLILPWLYLVVRMFNRSVPRFIVVAGYMVLYLGWLWGPFGWGVFISQLADSPEEGGLFLEYPTISTLLMFIHIASWVISLVWLLSSSGSFPHQPNSISRDFLLRPVYVTPFGLATLWSLFTFLAWSGLPFLGQ